MRHCMRIETTVWRSVAVVGVVIVDIVGWNLLFVYALAAATIADLLLWLMLFLWAPAGSLPLLIPLLEAPPFNLAALIYSCHFHLPRC